MLIPFLFSLTACRPVTPPQNNTDIQTSQTASPSQLITFEGVNNIVLIDGNGTRVDATAATEGTYEALAIVTAKDSKGTRDIEVSIPNVTLSKDAPINIKCQWEMLDTSSAQLNCETESQ